MAPLEAKFKAEATSQDDLRLFLATRELFYPGKQKLADEEEGPLALLASDSDN